MTKKQIIDEIVLETNIKRKSVESSINIFLKKIQSNLEAGTSSKMMGFGTFMRSKRKAKIGSNPMTKQRTLFKAKGWPKFVPSRQLKKAVE